MTGRCRDCTHWDAAEDLRSISYLTWESGRSEKHSVPGQWGDCHRIIRLGDHERDHTLEDKPEAPAFLSDGSGYFASLTTAAEFGCTLWEPRSA